MKVGGDRIRTWLYLGSMSLLLLKNPLVLSHGHQYVLLPRKNRNHSSLLGEASSMECTDMHVESMFSNAYNPDRLC